MPVFRPSFLAALVVVSTSFAAEPIKLFPGTSRLVVPGGATRVAIGDPAIADVDATAKDGIVLTALKAGTTTLKVWKGKATEPEAFDVQVETAGWDVVSVLVATRDLAEGSVVAPADVREAQLPSAFITSSVVATKSQSYALGHKTMLPIQKGDPLLWSALQANLPAAPHALTVSVGKVGTLSFKGVSKVAVGDPSVLDARVSSPGTVQLNARAAGVTTVVLLGEGGTREDWTVTVTAEKK